jgi:hypothetical protein
MNRPPRRRPADEPPVNPGAGGQRRGQGQPEQGEDQDPLKLFPGLNFPGQQQQRKQERPGKFAHVIRPSRRLNVIIFFCLLVFSFVWIAWTISDVTGEYASNGHDREVVRLSLMRLAANVKCRLNWGTGATMEATVNKIETNRPLHIVFQTPQKWVSRGRPQRTVVLDGRFAGNGMSPLQGSFQENEIKARLIENGEYVDVRLMRNSVTSLWRQVQAHWPWAEI